MSQQDFETEIAPPGPVCGRRARRKEKVAASHPPLEEETVLGTQQRGR